MSVSNDRLLSYAKMIVLNHDEEYNEVKRRIDTKMLDRFRKCGSDEDRKTIADIMNAMDIFTSELRVIVAENATTNED